MIVTVSGRNIDRHERLMDRAFQLRHAIFVEEKGWSDLRQADGRERDRFDDIYAIHHVCQRDDKVVGYQRLLPTTRPHLLSHILNDMCRQKPPSGSRVFEWTRFCVARGYREMHPRAGGPFLELAQGVVEWSMAHDVDTVIAAIDWRLMIIAMQLRFFVQPLGFPKRIGKDEVVALTMSFNKETLSMIQRARNSDASVFDGMSLASAAEAARIS